jgi:hypothetical protein
MCDQFARMADERAKLFRGLWDAEWIEQEKSRAEHLRDLTWLVQLGGRLWITVEEPAHPEILQAMTCLVLVRDGTVVWRERLGEV